MTIWQTPAGIVDEGGYVLPSWLNFGITLMGPPANGVMHVSPNPPTPYTPASSQCGLKAMIDSIRVLQSSTYHLRSVEETSAQKLRRCSVRVTTEEGGGGGGPGAKRSDDCHVQAGA